jgi:hypothetical protein
MPSHPIGKECILLRYTASDDAENFEMTVDDEEGPIRVMSDKEFFELMMYNRSGSEIWRKIVYM